MTEETHEFSPHMPSREEYLGLAFDQQPDVAAAMAATGVSIAVPTETLGNELLGVYVPKGLPDAEPMVVLVYSGGLSVSCLDLRNGPDAQAMVADQYDDEYVEIIFPTEVNGHAAVAWTACDIPLENQENGLEVPGTGIVLTASQVMWVDGTRVCWVTHASLDHDTLMQVARSMG